MCRHPDGLHAEAARAVRLTPDKFGATLARGLAPCYLLAGDEPLLVQECQDALRAAAREKDYEERETLNAGRDFDWGQLAETCATGSLFAARRIVELRLDSSPGTAGGRLLKTLAASPAPDVLLVVVAGRLESSARKSAWYTQFERSGVACYAWAVRSEAFPGWLAVRARAAGLRLEGEALTLLARQTEGNLLAAAQEIAKLVLLCSDPNGRVTVETVLASVADSAHFGVFDWIDRLLAGDRVAAIRGLANLRETGGALPAIVPALAGNLRQLATLQGSGAGVGGAGGFPRRQAGLRKLAARTRPRQVLGWLRRLSEIDALAKSGGEIEAWREMRALALAVAGERGALTRTLLAASQPTV